MNNMIELNGVTRNYRRGRETIHAVNGITLSVAPGEFAAIVGPSGSGKTTLLNLIGCVDKPDIGTLRIDGEETSGLNEAGLTKIRARKIGFVFQQFFLLPTLTALENVQLPAVFQRNGDCAERAAQLLERVGLSQRIHHVPQELSGGEMQRVAIARALINEPKILLADEPTGNLDSHNAEEIIKIFRELNAGGLSILMVTHNAELAKHARQIVTMKDGRVVELPCTIPQFFTSMRDNKPSSVKPFKELFCERFKCSAGQYRDEVLFQCMHPQSRCLLKLVLWFHTPATQNAISMVEEVGRTASLDDARELVAECRNQPKRSKRFLRIRFSSETLLRIYSAVMTPE